MHKVFWPTGIFGLLGAFALSGCGARDSISPVTASPMLPRGGVYAPTRQAGPNVAPLFPDVPYQCCGKVLIAPKFYLVFWDYKKYGDADRLRPLLEAYTKNMGGSAHNNIEIQYYEETGKKKTYITNPANQYGGSWDDESPIPKHPSDPQIAAEAVSAVAHFGFDPNGVYVIATAHNHSEAGFGTDWCSYHSDTTSGKDKIPYANLPYMTDASDEGEKCLANIIPPPKDESGKDEGMTIFAGHEYAETITDPYPFTAWTGPQGEIADPCLTYTMANDPFGKKSYTMQPIVSDATETCVQSYSPSP